jgi:diaminopimelate decarboxylase
MLDIVGWPTAHDTVPHQRRRPRSQFLDTELNGISGLHFHTLCEQNADDLATTLTAVEEKFGHLLRMPQFTYLNMGGGHWITQPFYDRERLVRLVRQTRASYQIEVWLEPGEAVAIHVDKPQCVQLAERDPLGVVLGL